MNEADKSSTRVARSFPPEERFRRTTIGLVQMIKRDLMESGRVYSAPGRPNWHSLQVFLLLRGDCMAKHCDLFLEQILAMPDGDERSDLLHVLSGPIADDEYIASLCSEATEPDVGSEP